MGDLFPQSNALWSLTSLGGNTFNHNGQNWPPPGGMAGGAILQRSTASANGEFFYVEQFFVHGGEIPDDVNDMTRSSVGEGDDGLNEKRVSGNLWCLERRWKWQNAGAANDMSNSEGCFVEDSPLQWRQFSPSTAPRYAHTFEAVYFGDKWYLVTFFGDVSGWKGEIFDVSCGEWIVPASRLPVLAGEYSNPFLPLVERVRVANTYFENTMDALSATGDVMPKAHNMVTNVREIPDDAGRYLHSTVCVKHFGDSTHTMYIFGGLNDGGDRLAPNDVLAVRLSANNFGALQLEVSRPACAGEPPCPRAGHAGCSLTSSVMVICGGCVDEPDMDEADQRSLLQDVYMLDLSTFVWSKAHTQSPIPLPLRMLFQMIPDRTGSRLIVFGGSESVAGVDVDDDWVFIGAITMKYSDGAADSSRDDSKSNRSFGVGSEDISEEPANVQYLVEWKRVVAFDGPFAKELCSAACVAVPAASGIGHIPPFSDDMGVRCYCFGGSANLTDTNALTELRITAADLDRDMTNLNSVDGDMELADEASSYYEEDEGDDLMGEEQSETSSNTVHSSCCHSDRDSTDAPQCDGRIEPKNRSLPDANAFMRLSYDTTTSAAPSMGCTDASAAHTPQISPDNPTAKKIVSIAPELERRPSHQQPGGLSGGDNAGIIQLLQVMLVRMESGFNAVNARITALDRRMESMESTMKLHQSASHVFASLPSS